MEQDEQEDSTYILAQLEKEVEREEGTLSHSASSVTREEEEEGAELSELEEELRREEEIRLLHEQDSLLEQVCFGVYNRI